MYTNLTDGIGWLLDSFVGEIDSFKKNVKLSHQQNNKTENDMRRLSMGFTISKKYGVESRGGSSHKNSDTVESSITLKRTCQLLIYTLSQ